MSEFLRSNILIKYRISTFFNHNNLSFPHSYCFLFVNLISSFLHAPAFELLFLVSPRTTQNEFMLVKNMKILNLKSSFVCVNLKINLCYILNANSDSC